MDDTATIEELKQKVKKFSEDRNWDQYHSPKELAIAIVSESVELLDHFKYKTQDQMNDLMKDPKRKQEIEHELADIMINALRFAQMNGIDIDSAIQTKLEHNNSKYPVEKSYGLNKKYNEL